MTRGYMSLPLLRRICEQRASNRMLPHLTAKSLPTDPGCNPKITIHLLSILFHANPYFQYTTFIMPSPLVSCFLRNGLIFAYTETEMVRLTGRSAEVNLLVRNFRIWCNYGLEDVAVGNSEIFPIFKDQSDCSFFLWIINKTKRV